MLNRTVRSLVVSAVLPLGVIALSGAARAETVIVPTIPGSLDGGDGGTGPGPDADGLPGGPGLPANADAGFTIPNSDALNSAIATGGAGGHGGDAGPPSFFGNGGNGGAGGDASAFAGTSGPSAFEANAQ